jgi:hypothetical protein
MPTSQTGFPGRVGGSGGGFLSGTAAPTTEGVDGDFYIRTTTSMIYGPKAAGVWPAGVSLIGPAGSTGPAGVAAAVVKVSSDSVVVGTGSKTFSYAAGGAIIGWGVGQRLRAFNTGSGRLMEGDITAVSDTSVTIDVDYTEGSGTSASWNIFIAGDRGGAGAAGATGPAGTSYPAFSLSVKVANYIAVDADFDGNKSINMDMGGPNTVTINTGLTPVEPVTILQIGAGQTTIVAGAGITIRTALGLKIRARYSAVTLIPLSATEFLLAGDTAI